MIEEIDWDALYEAAKRARENAYAPYSNFKVGSAVLADNEIFHGCNVENASYPVGCCAERNAIGAAIAAGKNSITGIVIVAHKVIPPCGMCRQFLAEFNPSLPIRLYGEKDDLHTTLAKLFPLPFCL